MNSIPNYGLSLKRRGNNEHDNFDQSLCLLLSDFQWIKPAA